MPSIPVQFDLVPPVIRSNQTEDWSNVLYWGGHGTRAGQPHCIAYVATGVTGFSGHTKAFFPGMKKPSMCVLQLMFDSLNGVSGQVRLTSFYYDANNQQVWDDNWHAPATPNPSYHPNAQSIDVLTKFNQMIDAMTADGFYRQLTIDVGPQSNGAPGSGKLYMARLNMLFDVA